MNVDAIFNEKGEAEVNELSDYIKLIERYTQNKGNNEYLYSNEPIENLEEYERLSRANYLFRGEGYSFPTRVTGAFRLNCSKLTDGKTCEDYDNHESCYDYRNSKLSLYRDFRIAVDEYYREVAHELSETEKNNFTAFAQHHGLPTNLLDVTFYPLAALFMACHRGNFNTKGELPENPTPAYVYIFEDYIDVTEIMDKYPKDTVVDLLIQNNEYAIDKIYHLLDGYCRRFQLSKKLNGVYMKNLCNCIYERFGTYNEADFKDIAEKAKIAGDACGCDIPLSRGQAYNGLLESINKVAANRKIELPQIHKNEPYLRALIFYLKCCDRKGAGEYMPYMVYRPKELFKRARLQRGFFIVQPFMALKDDGLYNENRRIRCIQDIEHSKVIIIKNPELILRQLDAIDINQGTMYGDFDNIAKHLRAKYAVK
ncbi:MAG: FRG domain-containing protein [Defluviitaleaceae bacterium]|nr:FRG domain-containing protein [Defluviitaleaceae bacterium]